MRARRVANMNDTPEVSLHRKFPREAPRAAPGIGAYGVQLWRHSTIESLKKFDPRTQIRNPVMFVVWLGALVTAALTIDPGLFGPSRRALTSAGGTPRARRAAPAESAPE
jgi:hypothetical protein